MKPTSLWSRLASFALLGLVGTGCQTPAPFDPGADCPRETLCGQCASHGACVWCGDPNDGGKGQCVAIGRAECAAPAEWARTPDRCGPPPATTAAAAPTTTTAAQSSPAAKAIGDDRYRAIRSALVRAFPEANVTDDVILGVSEILRAPVVKGPVMQEGSLTMEKAPIARHVEEKEHPLYLAYADHHRVKGLPPSAEKMESHFVLPLPVVRVRLPATLTAENAVIETAIGDVDLLKDHLYGSVDQIAAKYGGSDYFGARPARVDLLTPARSVGWRFGAMAVYLGYRKADDRAPSFYMLEAGTATGEAKMIYFSPNMGLISNVTSYYLPTPFVTMDNTYSGGVTMSAAPNEDEPQTLLVESRSPGQKDPYITVTVTYKRARTLELAMPIELTADAGARVYLIAKALGVQSSGPLEDVLADLARTFQWKQMPGAAPAPSAPAPTP